MKRLWYIPAHANAQRAEPPSKMLRLLFRPRDDVGVERDIS